MVRLLDSRGTQANVADVKVSSDPSSFRASKGLFREIISSNFEFRISTILYRSNIFFMCDAIGDPGRGTERLHFHKTLMNAMRRKPGSRWCGRRDHSRDRSLSLADRHDGRIL